MIGVKHDAVFLKPDDLRDQDAVRPLQLQFLTEFQRHVGGKLIFGDVDDHLLANGAIGLVDGNCTNDAGTHLHPHNGAFKPRDHHPFSERKFQGLAPLA